MFARIHRFSLTPPYSQRTRRPLLSLTVAMLLVSLLMPWGSGSTAYALTCTDPLGCVDIAPGAPIHIAYALTIAGGVAPLGLDTRNGVQIAIDEVGGKILGRNIQFDGVDDQCSAAGGAAAGAALAADPTIVAVIGTNCSSAARAAMPLISQAGMVMISPSNTNPDLTDPSHPDYHPGYFRTAITDTDQAILAAQYARNSRGIATAATIKDGSPYSDSLQRIFVQTFTGLGGTIAGQQTISVGQTDMSAQLAAIAAGHPGLIYMPVFMPEGAHIVNQARSTSGLQNTLLMGTDALYTEDIVTAAGQNIEGFLVTGIDTTKYSAKYVNSFLPAYYARFGMAPTSPYHIHAYDAFMLIKNAIERVAVVQPDNSIQIGRQALRNALYATASFPGLTGMLTCRPTGDCASSHLGILEFHAGRFPPELVQTHSFGDVPIDYWAWNFVERLYRAGITGGCATSPLRYCPEDTVTRAQMAVFLLRGIHTSSYAPPAIGSGSGFSDVPVDYWSGAWIKQLAAEGITAGCGSGNYCPEAPVTRAQMAVFLLRSKHGASYIPPAVGTGTGFGDVPPDYWAAAWIKQLVTEGITTGCGNGNYCPEAPVTRAQMAVFLVRTFGLP